MDSRQINKILQGLLVPHFLGTYARNGMPTWVVLPFSLLCNTDPNTDTSEHWIAVHVDEEGNGEYFDSYGLPPPCLREIFESPLQDVDLERPTDTATRFYGVRPTLHILPDA